MIGLRRVGQPILGDEASKRAGHGRRPRVVADGGADRARQHGARTFMAAAGCQVAFNVNDNETAQELADSIGRTTVLNTTRGTSRTSAMPWDARDSKSHAETGRHLLDAAEIRRLHPSRCIVLITGCLPILAWKVRHFRVRHWRKRWDAWRGNAPSRDPAPAAA